MGEKSEVIGLVRVSISHNKQVVIESSVDEYDNFYIDIEDWSEIKAAIDRLISKES